MVVSAALAVATAISAVGTFFVPGVLRGEPVMNGSARGTALVLLVVALPVLIGGMAGAARGSTRGLLCWLGAGMYMTYNAVLLLFATPFNRYFLAYVAMLGLSVAAVGTLLARLDAAAVAARMASVPARGLAVYFWVVAAANALAWLREIVPALGSPGRPAFLDGTGLTTNPIYVQDLALWLPLAVVVAAWLWRRRPWGYLLAGGFAVFWLIESIGVATDQWFGAHADPSSTVATMAGCRLFAALAVVGVVPVAVLMRRTVD